MQWTSIDIEVEGNIPWQWSSIPSTFYPGNSQCDISQNTTFDQILKESTQDIWL
jgi:hypothetical protein